MKGLLGTWGVILLALAVGPVGITRAAERAPSLDLTTRYGLQVDLKHYPQSDPQQALRSVIRAASEGDIEYLLAHLISPAQVDAKLRGNRHTLVVLADKATSAKSKRMIDGVNRHLNDGKWAIHRQLAWSEVEDVLHVSFEKIGNRWFMHNAPVPQPSQP